MENTRNKSSTRTEIEEMRQLFLEPKTESVPIRNSSSSTNEKKIKGTKPKLSVNKQRSEKRKLKCDCALVSLCILTVLSNSAYALIAPFLPIKLAEKGIPMYMFGFIFSIYSIAVIICSPIVGSLLSKYRRRNFLQVGMLAMATSMLAFAFSD